MFLSIWISSIYLFQFVRIYQSWHIYLSIYLSLMYYFRFIYQAVLLYFRWFRTIYLIFFYQSFNLFISLSITPSFEIYQCISVSSIWNCTVVLTRLLLGKYSSRLIWEIRFPYDWKPVGNSPWFPMCALISVAMRYCYRGTWTGLKISHACHLMWKQLHFVLNINSV